MKTAAQPYPGCMQDLPLHMGGRAQAASWDSVGASRGTGVPLDTHGADSQRVPVVFHKRHTWAPLGSWPWESAGLQAANIQLVRRSSVDVSLCAKCEVSYHRKASCRSAASSGRGNSRSTWSSTPWSQWPRQTAGWRRRCQLEWWGWAPQRGREKTVCDARVKKHFLSYFDHVDPEITPESMKYTVTRSLPPADSVTSLPQQSNKALPFHPSVYRPLIGSPTGLNKLRRVCLVLESDEWFPVQCRGKCQVAASQVQTCLVLHYHNPSLGNFGFNRHWECR